MGGCPDAHLCTTLGQVIEAGAAMRANPDNYSIKAAVRTVFLASVACVGPVSGSQAQHAHLFLVLKQRLLQPRPTAANVLAERLIIPMGYGHCVAPIRPTARLQTEQVGQCRVDLQAWRHLAGSTAEVALRKPNNGCICTLTCCLGAYTVLLRRDRRERLTLHTSYPLHRGRCVHRSALQARVRMFDC
jgi:hypothetical protein